MSTAPERAPQRSRRPFLIVLVLVVVAGVVVAVVRWKTGANDPALSALKRDPMANVELSGARLVQRTEQTSSGGKQTFGFSRLAQIILTFSTPTADQARADEEILVSKAQASDWQMKPDRDPAVGNKQLTAGHASLSIGNREEGRPSTTIEVILQLPGYL